MGIRRRRWGWRVFAGDGSFRKNPDRGDRFPGRWRIVSWKIIADGGDRKPSSRRRPGSKPNFGLRRKGRAWPHGLTKLGGSFRRLRLRCGEGVSRPSWILVQRHHNSCIFSMDILFLQSRFIVTKSLISLLHNSKNKPVYFVRFLAVLLLHRQFARLHGHCDR